MLALGLDIGGTKTALGLVDLEAGTIVRRTDFATPPRLAREPEFFQAINRAAQVHGPCGPSFPATRSSLSKPMSVLPR
jgi:predicted NBD/HSP70 family sugar kinase